MVFLLLVILVSVSSSWCLPTKPTPFGYSKDFGSRIVGGTVARSGQFPYAAAVFINTTDASYFCGGSLISNQFVLTSAFCLEHGTSFTIRLGTNSFSGSDPNTQTGSTSISYTHFDYVSDTLENDIGLVRLRFAIALNDYINVIQLPNEPLQDYTEVIAIGWGQVSDQNTGFAVQLNFVNLAVIPNAECRNVYGNYLYDSMVCADGSYTEGLCLGDTGGPLVQYRGILNTAVQVGVSSFYSGNGCDTTEPSGFARLYLFSEWIQELITSET